MARREELLRAQAEGWEAFIAQLDAVPPDRLDPPGLNAEGWAVRDVMWHVAFWCADAARPPRDRGGATTASENRRRRVGRLNDRSSNGPEGCRWTRSVPSCTGRGPRCSSGSGP